MNPTLIFLHVTANLVWIGSILATGLLLAAPEAAVEVRGKLAHRVYRRLAAPAFGVSLILGAIMLVQNADFYFVQTKFMHMKLTFALVVIVLHHVIGRKARRAARGTDPGRVGWLLWLLGASSALAAFAVVSRPL
ncbi:MAG TPA: CopD family protein [Polyangiaceae bacterium]